MAGPKGSRNTLSYGLYSKRISKDEAHLLGLNAFSDVEAEIALQRAYISRLALILEKNGLGPGSSDELSKETRDTVRLMNETMRALLRFIRAQVLRNDDPHLYRSQIETGKHQARRQLGVFDYLENTAIED